MKYKFSLGQVVRTTKDFVEQGEGPIIQIIDPPEDLKLLWGEDAPHYILRDNQTGVFIQVIERELIKK